MDKHPTDTDKTITRRGRKPKAVKIPNEEKITVKKEKKEKKLPKDFVDSLFGITKVSTKKNAKKPEVMPETKPRRL